MRWVRFSHLGLGLLLGWQALVFRTRFDAVPLAAFDSNGDGPHFVFLGAVVVSYLLSALAWRKVVPVLSGMWVPGAAVIAMTAGSLGIRLGASNAVLVVVSCIVCAVSAAVLLLAWGGFYARIGVFRAAVCVALSSVLAPLVRLLVSLGDVLVFSHTTTAIVFVLPGLSLACLLAALKRVPPQAAAERKGVPSAFDSMSLKASVAGIALYSFIFGAFYGISRFAPFGDSMPQKLTFLFVADMSGGLLFFLWTLLMRDDLTVERLHRPIPFLMISGLAFFPLLGSSITSPPMILVSTAWVYIFCVQWVFLAERASRDIRSSVRVFAWGQLTLNGAMLLGALVGTVLEMRFGLAPATLTVLALAFVYVLAMSLILLFAQRRAQSPGIRILSDAKGQIVVVTPAAVPELASLASPVGQDLHPLKCAIVVSTFGLSRREADVLPLLAKGLNAENIAEHLSVTRNTAKTHIQHIYEKLNVSSQQELLKVVERMDVQVTNG